MARHNLLGFALLLLAAVSGLVFWQSQREAAFDDSDGATQSAEIQRRFLERHVPSFRVNLEEIRRSRASAELADARAALPRAHRFPYAQVAALAKFADSCASEFPRITDPELRKALLWQRFRCGQISALPGDFFARKPHLHPSGKSYAALAEEFGVAAAPSPEYFHIGELLAREYAGAGLAIPPEALLHLLGGERIVLSHRHILFNADKQTDENVTGHRYLVFPIAAWNAFIAAQRLMPDSRRDGRECAYRESNICWTRNTAAQTAVLRIAAASLFGAFSALAIVVAGMAFRRSRERKRETTERLFTLQMLTHELRTPAASLLLSIETLRRDFDLLPLDSQEAFLRICEELQRLDRIVEASKSYLGANGGFALAPDSAEPKIPVNELLQGILSGYGERVEFLPLLPETGVRLHRYWVELCVRNLVDNALAHGSAPVQVALRYDGSELAISIVDQGQAGFASLEEMAQPFAKAKSSRGLGLGLAIVQKIAAAMGGKLEFSAAPTTFTLRLRSPT